MRKKSSIKIEYYVFLDKGPTFVVGAVVEFVSGTATVITKRGEIFDSPNLAYKAMTGDIDGYFLPSTEEEAKALYKAWGIHR